MRQLTFLLLFGTQVAIAADQEWKLQRDRQDVQVFTRSVDGSKFKQVKSTMTVTATVVELVALVRDVSACSDWAALCKLAKLIETVSETELYVYTLNDLPWPVADRDAVTHVVWSQNPTSLSVTMSATVVSGRRPEKRSVIRLSDGVTSWTFSPVEDGKVEVVSLAHIDPGGAVPAWLTNRLLVDSPYDTMVAMRKVTASHRYANSSFGFLSAP